MEFDDLEKRDGGVRQGGFAAMDEAEVSFDLEFGDFDLHEGPGLEFFADGEAGDERDTVAHLDEALDGLERGQFDAHAEGSFVAAKGLDDLLPLRRGDIVRDEGLRGELPDGDLSGSGEGMLGVDDEGELVAVDDDGAELRIFGAEGEDAELDGVEEDLVGDAAGERALDGELDAWVFPAELVEQREEVEAGVLVGGEVEAALVEFAEFGEGGDGVPAQVQELVGVLAEEQAGVGEGSVACAAVEQDLAQLAFELGDGLADGRLRAMEARGCAGEAALLGHCQKCLHLYQIQGLLHSDGGAPVSSDTVAVINKADTASLHHKYALCWSPAWTELQTVTD